MPDMQDIMEPSAHPFNWLVTALRRPRPTAAQIQEATDVFERTRAQMEAIHELRIWRAVRQMSTEPEGCPRRPRLIRHMLSIDEEEHVRDCTQCQAVLKKSKLSKLAIWFEHHERRWQLFKETQPSFYIRLVQVVTLMVLIATQLLFCSYPQRVSTQQMIDSIKAGEATASTINTLSQHRDELANEVSQLNNLLTKLYQQSQQSQAEQRKLADQLHVATKELNTLRANHRTLFTAIEQGKTIAIAPSGVVQILPASLGTAKGCTRCGTQPALVFAAKPR